MDNKRIVVALGRNAFGETFPEQQQNVKKAAVAIADLVEAKYQVVITHSNGPQVGMIQTAMTEFARLEPDDRTVAPMSVCGAMSEGYIGYDLQNAIREELINRGIYKTVSTIITQVRVILLILLSANHLRLLVDICLKKKLMLKKRREIM